MESGGYWRTTLLARRATRRGVLAAGGATALFLAACSGSNNNKAPSSGASSSSSSSGAASAPSGTPLSNGAPSGAPLTNASAPAGQAPSQLFLDAKSKPVTGKETIEELRDRFAQKNFKYLPGWKNGPKNGGTLRFLFDLPTSWDLTDAGASQIASWAMFHNKLVDFEIGDLSANTNIQTLTGDLADPPQQPDNQTYVFKLRPGIKWQNVPPVNGRALTADDIKYCIEVYQKAPVQGPIYRDVDSVQTPDANTVVIKLKQPASYFLGNMAEPDNLVFSREQHDAPGGLGTGPIGTGPFIYGGGTLHQGYKARKNPDYFKKDQWTGKQLPYLDGLEVTYIQDPDAASAAFRANQIDQITPADKQHWLDFLKTNPALITQICTPPPSAQPYYAWNLDKPPFNDVRVRQALSLAIDRDAILTGVYDGMAGYGYAQDQSYFGQEWPWTKDQLGKYVNFDVKTAKQLLAAAGFTNGLGRTIDFHYFVSVGSPFDNQQLVADQWKRNLGIDVNNIVPPDYATWADQFFNKKYADVIMAWFAGPSLDPDAYAYGALNSKSTKNYFHVNDPQIDQWTEAQRTELDTKKRQAILQQIMQRDLDQCYRLWTLNGYKINLRYPYVYGLTDQIHAWCPQGWGSKGVEGVWLDK
ncbi:MAG TPA: ABC transporter substrate-binding protein [Dehalococcoidia bacterium]|nr:ABC transporter substrate-binding protein [Dehalococcoidia bacterium]